MQLDVFTILVFLGTFCLIGGFSLLSMWWHARSDTGVLLWAISFFVRSLAFPLLAMRDIAPSSLSVDLPGGILFAALGLSWLGTRFIAGRSANVWIAALPVGIWLAFCQIPDIHDKVGIHLIVHSALMTVCAIVIAIEFWRGSISGDKLRRGLALVFGFMAGFHGFRGGIGLSMIFPEAIPQGENALAISFFVPLILVLIGSMLWLSIYWGGYVEELKNFADRDPLTNALNRRSFMETAEKLIKTRQKAGEITALLLFDLDHFKAVNDTHGHAAGDLVLKQFCDLITGELRSADLFARFGGEEFVAMLAVKSPSDAYLVAEKLRQIVSASTFEISGHSISVTVSVGFAVADQDYGSFASLMIKADGALYVAKKTGRNRVEKFRSSPSEHSTNHKDEQFLGGSVAA